jgi:predicted transposase YbfD/YdcC
VDKGHGRVEKRTIRLTTTLTKAQQFKGLRQGFELTRERTEKGKTTVEVVHGITSLSRGRADAGRVLGLVREHWGIENGSHYRRDVTLGEDASRVRKGSGPQVMAVLRNLVIYLCSFSGKPSLAAANRHYVCHPEKSLALLSIPIRE